MSETETVPRLLLDQAMATAIQRHVRGVIRAAATTVSVLQPARGGDSGMRENQLRNVVNAALSASSVEEIAAFILYQMGRSTNSRQWLYGNFGDRVVADLMSGAVRAEAEAATKAASKAVQAEGYQMETPRETELFPLIYIALARQYLGYLNRLFVFVDRTGRWDELPALLGIEKEHAHGR